MAHSASLADWRGCSTRRGSVVLIPLVLLLLLPSSALAQSVAWTNQFESSEADVAFGVVATETDVFVDGFTFDALPGETAIGGSDGFLRRIDDSGQELWTFQFGTRKDDYIVALGMDATGLYVTGATSGTFPGQTKLGGDDAVLAKYGFDGNELWTVQFGTEEADFPSNVVADATGVYVIGSTNGSFPGQRDRRAQDAFLTRFDAEGNQDWVVQFGSGGSDVGYANALSPAGIFVNGFTDGRLPGQSDRGEMDAFVSLFASDGTRLWLRQFGTKRLDLGLGIVADPTAVYVSGQTYGHFRGFTSSGDGDAFVRRFSAADGANLWTHQFGTPGFDVANGLALVGTDVFAVGGTSGVMPGAVPAGGGDDAFAVALDTASGDELWTLQFGTSRSEVGNWAWAVPGALYAPGATGGTFAGETRSGSQDAFVTRINLS